MTNCLQCGKCCRVVAMKAVNMSTDVIDYLIKRGASVDGDYILLPHRCQHLRLDERLSVYRIEQGGGEGGEDIKVLETPRYRCDIHDTPEYPVLCKRFQGHGAYYIPSGCVFLTKQDEEEEHNIYLKSLKPRKEQRLV